jgi:hypothetical protein
MATSYYDDKIDIGRVLQRGFAAIGSNAPAFFLAGIVLVGLPTVVMNYLMLSQVEAVAANPGDVAFWSTYAALVLVVILTTCLLQAAVVRSTILDLSGRPADFGSSLAIAMMLVLPIVGLAIVSGIAIGLGFLLVIVPGVILYLMWSVAVPVLVEERRGVFGSLSRSAELTKGSKGRILGVVLIYICFSLALSRVTSIFSATDMTGMGDIASPLLFAALEGVVGVVDGVVMSAMLASLYVELRTVREGASTDSLAAVFE